MQFSHLESHFYGIRIRLLPYDVLRSGLLHGNRSKELPHLQQNHTIIMRMRMMMMMMMMTEGSHLLPFVKPHGDDRISTTSYYVASSGGGGGGSNPPM